jgi:hypothetical protein
MGKKGIGKLLSHWHQTVEDPGVTPLEFYELVVDAITDRALPNVLISAATWHEAGAFSSRRTYLRIRWGKLIFDISAAPFGNSIAVSWWLSEATPGLIDLLWEIPVLGSFLYGVVRPATFYAIDTAAAFQHAVHDSVLEAIDAVKTDHANRRSFCGNEAPILSGFYTDN